MAVQEESKEPHVSSVLPWIILHRIIWQEEDTFHSLCHQQQLQNPEDEGGGKWVWVGVDLDLCPCLLPLPQGPAALSKSCEWAWHLVDRRFCDTWTEAEAPLGSSLCRGLRSQWV